MNHLGRFEKGIDMVLRQAVGDIKRGHADSIIKSICRRYKDNSMIKYKAEINKIVGIPYFMPVTNKHKDKDRCLSLNTKK